MAPSGRFSNIGNHFWRLDELLKLLRDTKRELSPSESKGPIKSSQESERVCCKRAH